MFDISTKLTGNSAKVTVTRTLQLPEANPLPSRTLKSDTHITFDMGGVGSKSAVAKEIIKGFQNGLKLDLNIRGKKADNAAIAMWNKLAQAAATSNDEKKITQLAKAFEKKTLDDWNDFGRKQVQLSADGTFKSVMASALKKHQMKAETPKLALSADELKSDRVGILTGVLAVVAAGGTLATGGGAALLAAGIAGLTGLAKGYQSAWKLNQKRMSDVEGNIADLKRGIEDSQSSLEKLSPAIARLADHKDAIEAGIIAGATALNETRKELERLEKLAKTDNNIKEGKHLQEVTLKADKLAKHLVALRNAASKNDEISDLIKKAEAALKAANSAITIERSRWDKVMDAYNKISDDSNAVVGAVQKIVKAVG